MMTKHSQKQISNQDKEMTKTIQSGLDILDQYSNIESPPLSFFESLVEQKKEQEREKLIKDLVVFALMAISILTILVGTIIHSPVVFIAIQLVSIVVMPFYLFIMYRKRKQVDQHDA